MQEQAVLREELTSLELVGPGSYGQVWKGKWNGKVVAIKKIRMLGITEKQQRSIAAEIGIPFVLIPSLSSYILVISSSISLSSLYPHPPNNPLILSSL